MIVKYANKKLRDQHSFKHSFAKDTTTNSRDKAATLETKRTCDLFDEMQLMGSDNMQASKRQSFHLRRSSKRHPSRIFKGEEEDEMSYWNRRHANKFVGTNPESAFLIRLSGESWPWRAVEFFNDKKWIGGRDNLKPFCREFFFWENTCFGYKARMALSFYL